MQLGATINWPGDALPAKTTSLMQRPGTRSSLRGALALGVVFCACSGEAQRERGTTSAAVSAAPDPVAPTETLLATQTSPTPDVSGGQSGGEGNGANEGILVVGSPQPCACMGAGAAGTVLSMSEACVRVQVTEVYNPYGTYEVGDVLGGILDLACRRSEPVRAGDQVLFQYDPGRTDECPAYRQCVNASCRAIDDACRMACLDSTLGVCTDPKAWSLQTGRFSALLLRGEKVAFHFAGEDREATISELTTPQCWTEHFELLKEPGAAAAWQLDQQRDTPDPSHEGVECFDPEVP